VDAFLAGNQDDDDEAACPMNEMEESWGSIIKACKTEEHLSCAEGLLKGWQGKLSKRFGALKNLLPVPGA
jgi:hypothetical protein